MKRYFRLYIEKIIFERRLLFMMIRFSQQEGNEYL